MRLPFWSALNQMCAITLKQFIVNSIETVKIFSVLLHRHVLGLFFFRVLSLSLYVEL